jgi:hypothetical protein
MSHNNVDLEVGLSNNKQSTLSSVELNYTTSSTDDFAASCCMKSFAWVFVMIFAFPLTFCDLYYGYNDNSCVSEPAGKLAINLKDYLLIGGWINASILIILTLGLCFINFDKTNDTYFACCGGLSIFILSIVNIFSIVWNVFGAIIFWSLMDTSDCGNSVYNYVFASLIIKLCFNVIGILQKKNDKDK